MSVDFASRSKTVLEIVASLAVIAGIPFFFVQQGEEVKAQSVASAMQFVSMSNSGETAGAIARVAKPWEALNVAEFTAAKPSSAAIELLKNEVDSLNVSQEDISRTADFYNAALSCRRREICDPDMIDIYFRDPITHFYCAYDSRLAAIAKSLNRPDYATALRDYAGKCSGS